MKVFLKSLSGQKTSLEVRETATVSDLKQQLAAILSAEARLLKLILVGKILEDGRTLEESGVKNEDQVVYMLSKPKPETPPPADDPELALGEQYESTLQQFVDLGFPRAYATAAMRAANNDPALAYELLERGEPLDPQADEDDNPDAAEPEGNPLAFLLENEAFLTIRRQLQSNPSLLTNFLNQLQENNPELFALISEYPDEFQELLDAEEGVQPADDPENPAEEQGAGLSAEDRAAVDKLVALGFAEEEALEAYLSCDRNEELAANFLFESQGNR